MVKAISYPCLNGDNEDDSRKDCSSTEIKRSVEHNAAHFRLPLEAKGVLSKMKSKKLLNT